MAMGGWKKGLMHLSAQQRLLVEAYVAQEVRYGRRARGNLKAAAVESGVKYNYAKWCKRQVWWEDAVARAARGPLQANPRRETPPRGMPPASGDSAGESAGAQCPRPAHLTEEERCLSASLLGRRDAMLSFWADMVVDTDLHPRDRLRASELLAKAQGLFKEDGGRDKPPVRFIFHTGEIERIRRERAAGLGDACDDGDSNSLPPNTA